MKYILGVTICYVLFSMVSAENCTVNTECTQTTCGLGAHVICEHHEDGITIDGGLCTCAIDASCSTAEDCYAPAHEELDCADDARHCYDSLCICTRWPIGGGGIGGGIGGGGGFP